MLVDSVILSRLENYEKELRIKVENIDNSDINLVEVYLKEILEFLSSIRNLEEYQKDNFLSTVDSLEYSINKSLKERNLQYIKNEAVVLIQYLSCVVYKIDNDISINGDIDTEKIKYFWEHKAPIYGLNHFTAKSEEQGKFKYDLSILVLAYNQLEYTKKCVESLMKYLPTSVSYELILFNHGSSDGTLEYFNSIPNAKVIDIHKNGPGFDIVYSFFEGEYAALVSNDVLVTENAIENMLKCIKSDEKIALVVPHTTNISNNQQIADNFQNIDEMYKFASEFNKSNSDKWEQKAALVTPICVLNTSSFVGKNGIFFNIKNIGFKFAFTDDLISYFFRQTGGKLILARDTFCYHFGSVTVNTDILDTMKSEKISNDVDYYLNERVKYFRLVKYNPWADGAKESVELHGYLNRNKLNEVKILGIGSGLGANLYKIQYNIKNYTGNHNTTTYCINDVEAINDVVANSYDEYQNVGDIFDISIIEEFEKNQIEFDYILIEAVLPREMDYKKYVEALYKILKVDGEIAIISNASSVDVKLLAEFPWAKATGNWIVLRQPGVVSQKMIMPCKVFTWSSRYINEIINVFEALMSQQFDITIELDGTNFASITKGSEVILVNDPNFFAFIEANKELQIYLRTKNYILIVDNYNIKETLLINPEFAKFLEIKYISANENIQKTLEMNGINVLNTLEYGDNVDQNIYNEFITYFISLENNFE